MPRIGRKSKTMRIYISAAYLYTICSHKTSSSPSSSTFSVMISFNTYMHILLVLTPSVLPLSHTPQRTIIIFHLPKNRRVVFDEPIHPIWCWRCPNYECKYLYEPNAGVGGDWVMEAVHIFSWTYKMETFVAGESESTFTLLPPPSLSTLYQNPLCLRSDGWKDGCIAQKALQTIIRQIWSETLSWPKTFPTATRTTDGPLWVGAKKASLWLLE